MQNDPITTLRTLLYEAPSESLWLRLRTLFEHIKMHTPDVADIAENYAQTHLQSWPTHLRMRAPGEYTQDHPDKMHPTDALCALNRYNTAHPASLYQQTSHLQHTHAFHIHEGFYNEHDDLRAITTMLDHLSGAIDFAHTLPNVHEIGLSTQNPTHATERIATSQPDTSIHSICLHAQQPFHDGIPLDPSPLEYLICSDHLDNLKGLLLSGASVNPNEFSTLLGSAWELERLTIRDGPTSSNALRRLAAAPNMHNLQHLELSNCMHAERRSKRTITASDTDILYKESCTLHKLHSLDVSHNLLSLETLLALCNAPIWDHLVSLRISHVLDNAKHALPFQLPEKLDTPQLRALDLSLNPVRTALLSRLPKTSWFSKLEYLNLTETFTYNAQELYPRTQSNLLTFLEALAHHTHMRSLHLSGFALPEDLLSPLLAPQTPLLKTLQHLDLSTSHLSYTLCSHLVEQPLWLTTLNLSRCLPCTRTLRRLAEAPTLTTLTRLNLSQNELSSSAVKTLSKALFMRSLIQLDLSDNAMQGPGLSALFLSTACQNLRSLNLSNNPISDRAMRALTPLLPKHLHTLNIQNISLTPKTYSSLTKTLPDTQILHNQTPNSPTFTNALLWNTPLPSLLPNYAM